MPSRPKTPCAHPGCPRLTHGRYCEEHQRQEWRRLDSQRGSSSARGYNRRWQKARRWFLRRNPLCVECQREGKITPATVVDHIKPHKGDPRLFWDVSNWQPLCTRHHNAKTARETFGGQR